MDLSGTTKGTKISKWGRGMIMAKSVDAGSLIYLHKAMGFAHKFIGWDRPFPLSLADYLKREEAKGGAYDHVLIWVPSARFGRHLVAGLFPETATAIHPPRILTPAQYFSIWQESTEGLAGEVERLLAWRAVLAAAHPNQLVKLFPGMAEKGRSEVPLELAGQLVALQDELAELGWSIERVAQAEREETERWEALALLEDSYHEHLSRTVKADPHVVLGRKHVIPEEFIVCRKLIIAGIHNLTMRHERLIADHAAAGMEVEFIWSLPEDLARTLDEFGRPLPDKWGDMELPSKLVQGVFKKFADPRKPIEQVIELADRYGEPVDVLSLVTCEEDIRSCLIETGALQEVEFYNPDGVAMEKGVLGQLLLMHLDWWRSGKLDTLASLLEHPVFQQWCGQQGMDAYRLQKDLSKVRKEHLIVTYRALGADGLVVSEEIRRLRMLAKLMETYLFNDFAKGFLKGIWVLLNRLVENAVGDEENVHGLVEELYEVYGDRLRDNDGMDALRYLLRTRRYYPERSQTERPVSGWLEAAWETAPHLVVLGIPDSKVPGGKSPSSFLGPGLRTALGLPGHLEESAFHALRLRVLLECRERYGRLDLIHYAHNLAEEPTLPSRFLFHAAPGATVDRVRLLLEKVLPEPVPSARFGITYTLPEPAAPNSISASGLRTYLIDPFQYYLRYCNRWQPLEGYPVELDALLFGQLAHSVLEAYGADSTTRHLRESQSIASVLSQNLDTEVLRKFGSSMLVPVQIQVDSLRQRLRHAAKILADLRDDGWEIYETEWNFGKHAEIHIDGLKLSGIIDLILYKESSEEYLIVDYKTSDSSKGARGEHLTGKQKLTGEETLPERYFTQDEKTYRWDDLQLPIYAHALFEARGIEADCAYISLTKAVSNIKFSRFLLTQDELESALRCTRAIIAKIRKGEFPAGSAQGYNEPYLLWFGGDFAQNIACDWKAKHMEVGS
jgi:ATP-dependent helicase/nuclease subunit B